MKKKLVLRKEWWIVLFILVIVLLYFISSMMDKSDYDAAVERCGGSQNVVTKYTSTGDKYYTCKNK